MSEVYELANKAMRAKGAADAASLRSQAASLDGTALIAREEAIPQYDPQKDYSLWPVGAPVWEEVDGERQVFTLITPHNAANYPGELPSNTPALWSITHTKDPAAAKQYTAPNGTSGLWMSGEVCLKNGHLWKSTQDNNPYPPGETGTETFWEDLGAAPEEDDGL